MDVESKSHGSDTILCCIENKKKMDVRRVYICQKEFIVMVCK